MISQPRQRPRVLYWFRTDLRLHDSPALKAALDLEPECLFPVWCWDPHYVYRARVGPNRWQFLLDCQSDLSTSITRLNTRSKLLVVREAPQSVLPKLFLAWRISHLVFEKDTDAYARDRDEEVMRVAKETGVHVIVKVGRTLYDPDDLVKANGGKPTMSITQVQNAGKKLPDVPRPIPPPKYLPDPGDTTFHFDQTRPLQEPDINRVFRSGNEESYAHLSGPNDDFAVPKISELGLKPPTTTHRGGETVALAQLDKIIADETYTATFSKPDTAPTAFSPQSTTLLSPHLHFGSLSCREFYHRARAVIDTYKKAKAATIPTNLIGQLLFRDMYFGAQAALGHSFAQMVGNPYCRFIPWHLPSKISPSTGLTTGEYTIDSPLAEAWFQRWKFGRTGFPWIDALMRQLRQEGWIHHLGRHAVACFLTRGGCYIDWERGADVFAEWLIDHEAACNAGNWQWLACAAFYSQFFRCYSPIAFPKKWDPEGKFVKRYVPELAGYSQKYIYEPWKAPVADQKNWGCLIQGDGNEAAVGVAKAAASMKTYPKPMFDFTERREICIQSIKRAYKINLYGADPMVQNGTWKQLFGVEDSNQGGETIKGTDEHKAREAPTAAFAAGGEGEEGVDEDEREAAHRGIGDQGGEESIKGREREKRDGRQMTLDRLFTKGRSAGEDREGNKRRRKM